MIPEGRPASKAVHYSNAHGRGHVDEPAPGILATRIDGRATVGSAGVLIVFAEGMISAGRRLLVYHDWERLESYEAEAKRSFVEWSTRVMPHWDGSHILLSSPLIAMAVSVASLTQLGKITTYSSRQRWERSFAQACAARGVVRV
jgi:hypothetical protein